MAGSPARRPAARRGRPPRCLRTAMFWSPCLSPPAGLAADARHDLPDQGPCQVTLRVVRLRVILRLPSSRVLRFARSTARFAGSQGQRWAGPRGDLYTQCYWKGATMMSRVSYVIAGTALAAACLGVTAYAQQASRPPFATTKVDGTDNVYVFRYGNHQSMFVVTSAGVIATDPIGYGRPQAVVTYVDEIRKVSNQPIKYVIYSHHHFDHIAGGKPFQDAR